MPLYSSPKLRYLLHNISLLLWYLNPSSTKLPDQIARKGRYNHTSGLHVLLACNLFLRNLEIPAAWLVPFGLSQGPALCPVSQVSSPFHRSSFYSSTIKSSGYLSTRVFQVGFHPLLLVPMIYTATRTYYRFTLPGTSLCSFVQRHECHVTCQSCWCDTGNRCLIPTNCERQLTVTQGGFSNFLSTLGFELWTCHLGVDNLTTSLGRHTPVFVSSILLILIILLYFF